ncbi:unnamed protein product, partial [Clonostachys byssicola]
MDAPALRCERCSMMFSRPAHLWRHKFTRKQHARPFWGLRLDTDQTVDSPTHEFQCSFCLTTLTRRHVALVRLSDSLRKHLRSCLLRKVTGEPMPDPESRGRKRRACYNCSSSKRACSFDAPCKTCVRKGLSCSYPEPTSNLNANLSRDCRDLWGGTDELPESAEESLDAGRAVSRMAEEDPDLHACHASAAEVGTSDQTGTQTNAPSALTPLSWPVSFQRDHQLDSPGSYPQVLNYIVGSCYLENERFEFLMNFDTGAGIRRVFNFVTSVEVSCSIFDLDVAFQPADSERHDVSNVCGQGPVDPVDLVQSVEWLYDPLLPQSKAVWEKLLGISQIGSTGPVFTNRSEADECIKLFNPKSLRILLSEYWNSWHHHCPIIHRPSLDLLDIPVEMMIAMCLLGACSSPEGGDAIKAQKWLDATETLVFSIPWLSRTEVKGISEPTETRLTKVRLLQTALLVCVLQTWEGTESARLRVRELRYPFLVQASRELRTVGLDLENSPEIFETQFDWEEFIIEEQLTRVKTFIFLLDTAFTIFHSTPPRVTIPDLKFPFPCPDIYFHVDDKEHLLAAIRNNNQDFYGCRRTLISQAVQTLCEGSSRTSIPPRQMKGLDGFILISALHSVIFQHEVSSLLSQSVSSSIAQALEKWLQMWEHDMSHQESHLVSRSTLLPHGAAMATGFTRHSYEYFSLALVKLNRLHDLQGREQTGPLNDFGEGNVKRLISSA